MKHIFQLLFLSAFLLAITSCKKAENKIFFEGGTPPQLSSSSGNVVLEPGSESNVALVLSWTNPDYKFTTGMSSQDVTYTLEMDTLGGNFSSSNKVTTVIAKDTKKVYSVGELNGILGNTMVLQLDPRREYTLQIRVTSSISVSGGGAAGKLTSNVVSLKTTPFAPPPKVAPPTTGHLYLVGDATPGDWANPVPVPSQEFTKVSNTVYEITVPLSGGKHYLFLPLNGDWGNKYACHDKTTQSPDGGNFGYNGNDSFWNDDIPGPTANGNYKITVDFQLGKYSVVKQ
ncbi:MAG TPA: SusE domain-containing protein [Chitinophagaceae bacterium]|jgi:starch-binding outer membrane protein SusE/F|nr:SusE domain-containing protein [Chitinophagaceae bacterium]